MDLNIIANIVTFANAFTNIEPAQNFDGHQCVEPSFFDCCIFPGTSFSASQQFSKTLTPNGKLNITI